MRTALYSALPIWRMLVFDGTMCLSAFAPPPKGAGPACTKLTAADDAVLHAGFLPRFDDMWRQAHPEDGR